MFGQIIQVLHRLEVALANWLWEHNGVEHLFADETTAALSLGILFKEVVKVL